MSGIFQLAVLVSVAALGGDADAAAVRREVIRRLGRDSASGAVHVTLQRLQSLNLIASEAKRESRRTDGRVPRRYWITAAGRQALKEAQSEIGRVWAGFKLPAH